MRFDGLRFLDRWCSFRNPLRWLCQDCCSLGSRAFGHNGRATPPFHFYRCLLFFFLRDILEDVESRVKCRLLHSARRSSRLRVAQTRLDFSRVFDVRGRVVCGITGRVGRLVPIVVVTVRKGWIWRRARRACRISVHGCVVDTASVKRRRIGRWSLSSKGAQD